MNRYSLRELLLLLITTSALACGPSYPPFLFTHREGVLLSIPDQIFNEEMTKLLEPASPNLIERTPNGVRGTLMEESGWVDADGFERVKSARDAESFEKCVEIVAPLPEDLQLYLQGVWLFYHREDRAKQFHAIDMFDSLIAVDSTGLSTLSVRAHYMKGRTYDQLSLNDSAIVSFQRTRDLVIQGAPDSLGLGNISYWSEGYIQWKRGNSGKALHCWVQHKAGSPNTNDSWIRDYTRLVLRDDALFQNALHDSVAQQVLASYIANRYSANWCIMDSPANVENMERLIAIALENPVAVNQNALDNFAVALYRAGNYSLAERLITGSTSSLSWQVRMKLAIRSGSMEKADEYYEKSGHIEPYYLIARGKFEEALQYLSGEDRAYVLERLLTTDQLLTLSETDMNMKDIIARRLMREGRTEEALHYYNDHQETAQKYATAYEGANTSSGVDRAEHLYEMVCILADSGMEILGYELGPDWTMTHSNVSGLYLQKNYPEGFASNREYHMLQQTEPDPNYRLHYRYLAAELALEAANLLPKGSQAYDGVIAAGQRAANHELTNYRKSALGNYRWRSGVPDFDAVRAAQE